MGRRTKAELIQSNYYDWLKECKNIRAKKKSGIKLTADEKIILKTIPTKKSPYVVPKDAGQSVAKKNVKSSKIDFDKTVKWDVKGGSFLCAVFNLPRTDEDCMLMCHEVDCPFYEIGYFRSHGVKF